MKRAGFIALAAASIGAAVLPEAEAATVRPALAPFRAITISGVARLDFTESATQSVVVNASKAVLRRLELTVSDGVLHVGLKSGTIFHRGGKPHLLVSAPRLDSLVVSGVASGTVSGLSGASFRLAIGGTGSITVAGSVARADLTVSGAGSIDARRLLADDLTVDVSGAGSLHGFARKSADVRVGGVGSVAIAGDPASRKIAKSGVGSVRFD